MVEGFARLAGVHFLPDDRAAADRALATGSPLVDADTEVARALGAVADAAVPPPVPRRGGGRRRRLLRR